MACDGRQRCPGPTACSSAREDYIAPACREGELLKERRAAVRASALGHPRGPGRLLLLLTLGGVPAAVPLAAQTIASAANQTFVVGNPPTTMSAITITDAKPPTITAANDIRIRIPASFNMTWNTAL